MLYSRRLVASLLTLVLAATAAPLHAAKVKVWQQNKQAQFDKARFKQAIVTSDGVIQLARQVKPLANLQATNVWDVVEDTTGNLFVATGDEGKLFKITPDGKATVVYTSGDSQILCLARGPDGSIFAGTGPGGKVIRVTPDGAKVLIDDLDSYVWCLVFDPDSKTLFAGTGPKGRIYQITADGKARVYYQTKQEHILCLAPGPKKSLYAGTDKGGLVYRIDSKNKGFVLYHAHQAEVRCLLVSDDALYAGTSSPTHRPKANSKSTTARNTQGPDYAASADDSSLVYYEISSSTEIRPPLPLYSGGEGRGEGGHYRSHNRHSLAHYLNPLTPAPLPRVQGRGEYAIGTVNDDLTDGSYTQLLAEAAPAPTTPPVGENSVYRIAHDGTVREIFRDKVLVLRLLKNNGKLLVATGMQGQLFEVDEATKEKSELVRLDSGQIHCLIRRHDDGIVLGTGDPGKLYLLEDRYAAKGTVVSDVLDAKILSKWGALSWRAVTPPGTSVSVAVRAGNVSEPDDTWSDWSAEQNDPRTSRAEAPTARYFQYRVTLASSDPQLTPRFRHFVLRYKTTNQAPEITSLDVPDLEAGNVDNPRKLKIRWSATDPNEDELTFRLYFRKQGWKNWVMLEEDLEKKEYDWDTTTVPSGIYQIKVVASDRRDNSPEETLTAQRISVPVTVAHAAPIVTVRFVGLDGDQAILEASAADPLVRLTEASFAVNGKRWSNIFPVDGLFDSKTENFRFKTDALRPGNYVLMLRVKNAAGNVGSSDVLFTVGGRK